MWQKGLLNGKITFLYANKTFNQDTLKRNTLGLQLELPPFAFQKGLHVCTEAPCRGPIPASTYYTVTVQGEIDLRPRAGCEDVKFGI